MIVFCELSFDDATHVPFNAGLLATVQIAYPKEEFHFFGAAEHIEELKQAVGKQLAESICWQEIHPPTQGTVYSKRFFCELRIILRLLRTLRSDSTSRLLLTSAYPSTVLALKLARWLLSSQVRVQIVLHGLSGVVGKRCRHPIRRLQDTRTAVTVPGNDGILYLVLEQSIRNTILKNLPFLSSYVQVLDHPISPREWKAESRDLTGPIRFGFLGLALSSKGFPLFVEVATAVSAKYERRVEFHAIGRLPRNDVFMNGIEVLATKPKAKLMSRSDFILSVSQLHFIVLPHEPVPYTLTASGVLLDAIDFGKPIIARKIPIFEEIFEKHGDIGYLFDGDEKLRGIVEQILEADDKSRYRSQVLNLKSLRKTRAPEALAAAYRQICRIHEGVLA
jgi:glycosyltransferase involved in cell wall biosynthesis